MLGSAAVGAVKVCCLIDRGVNAVKSDLKMTISDVTGVGALY